MAMDYDRIKLYAIKRNIIMLDFHKLNIFLIAAETLNFTQTAQQLNMTQPSVSQHIQTMEEYFNTSLFTRMGRNLELTEAGIALIPYAREAMRLAKSINESIQPTKGEFKGQLRIGCSTSPGKYILPKILSKFCDLYPKIHVSSLVTSEIQSIQMLYDGEIHLALSNSTHHLNPDFESIPILHDSIILITPSEHKWAKRKIIDPQELLSEIFILREEESGTYSAISHALENQGISIKKLKSTLTLGSSEAIAIAVREGVGVGFVSRFIANSIGGEQIAKVDISNLNIGRTIYMSRIKTQYSNQVLNEFWNFLHQLRQDDINHNNLNYFPIPTPSYNNIPDLELY